jgi:hypothetical protein
LGRSFNAQAMKKVKAEAMTGDSRNPGKKLDLSELGPA